MRPLHKPIKNEIHFRGSLNPDLQFECLDLQFIYKIKKNHSLSDPQRVHFYLLIFIENGQGHHMIDFHNHEIREGFFILVRAGQVQAFLSENKVFGPVIVFTNAFLQSLSTVDSEMYEVINLFRDLPSVLHLGRISQKKLASAYFRAKTELSLDNTFQSLGRKTAALNFFISLTNLTEIQHIKEKIAHNDDLVKKFNQLLDVHFAAQRAASFYARKLNVSTRTLDRRLKKEIGETSKRLHVRRLLLECKRNLTKLDKPIKHIAYELHFSDSAAFSRFFKQESALTPIEFREALVKNVKKS